MVTEPEPGFVSLVEQLDRVRGFLRVEFVQSGPYHAIDGHDLGGYLATLDDAIEVLQVGDGSSREPSPSAGSVLDGETACAAAWLEVRWHPDMPAFAHEQEWLGDWGEREEVRDLFRAICKAALSSAKQVAGTDPGMNKSPAHEPKP